MGYLLCMYANDYDEVTVNEETGECEINESVLTQEELDQLSD